MDIIGIDYNKAIRQSTELASLAKQMDNEIIRLENLISQIKNEWCGPASEQFRNELILLLNDMRTTRYNMSSTSESIKIAADKLNVN